MLEGDRKLKSNDIVNGVARVDIFDTKGLLLIKKGSQVREIHYQRMRDDGLIKDQDESSQHGIKKQDINYSPPGSIHSRLGHLVSAFFSLQKSIIQRPAPVLIEELDYIAQHLKQLCDENIYQVLGELFLSDARQQAYIKPVYIAASLVELIKRFNEYDAQNAIDNDRSLSLIKAALLHNLGLLTERYNVYENKQKLDAVQLSELRHNYPSVTVSLIEKLDINDNVMTNAINGHTVENENPSFEASLLRTPFIYAGIAMKERTPDNDYQILNASREFAWMFSEKKLDPVLGGLFLKINGLAPVGSIMLFNTREKAVILSGPPEGNISASTLRLITNRSGVQLFRPGEKFRLNKTKLVQKGLNDHHQFAWNKFLPFVAWEK